MKTGDVYVMTQGAYDDYHIFAIVEAVRDLDAEVKQIRDELYHDTYGQPSMETVITVLINRKFVREAPRAVELFWGYSDEHIPDCEKDMLKKLERTNENAEHGD